VLHKQFNKVEDMVHYGQIEEKDAGLLKEEIEAKLYHVTVNPPKVNFEFEPVRIIKYSDLTSIFEKEQL
jgi:hypothetical protein